ncbi:guanylate kinase [Kaustia mangrovi]|uniref:Guanylate kinase n=1 Tax=Kaustia mangrovi TaxID=2593653 RepID=A0A7S8C8M0_9HYPH|nr:guanylate kinase [Kaustia mangrovi]QPC45428.1 guanylate kinase [Kaustia mangrovi]
MLVLSSPSGAGKSTLSRLLVDEEKQSGQPFHLSVSVTTREKRPSEVEGVHYQFISRDRFAAMRDRGDLLEWAEVHGNFYGTPRDPVEEALKSGRDVLFDIDWQGTLQLYEQMREDVVSVFILPPSIAELKARLERRAEDSDDVITRRLAGAKAEMEHWSEYDYVVVNTDVEQAFKGVKAILDAERLKRVRRPGLADFVRQLQDDL